MNTSGPNISQKHYSIPPLGRLDLDNVLWLIREWKYFVLHAPRQTGKTSALLALQDLLNSGSEGDYRCVYVNVEGGQAMRENVAEGLLTILQALSDRAQEVLDDNFLEKLFHGDLDRWPPGNALARSLRLWARADPRPLVLLIDEIDALVGNTLISVLRQLRSGYDMRPRSFPQSIVLCGVRDLHDYRIHSASTGENIAGGSAFNISAKSLRLGDFTRGDVEALLAQHTAETGQQLPPGSAETRLETNTGTALAGQRALPRGLFRKREWARPRPPGHRGRHPRRTGEAHPKPGDAPRPAR